MKSWILRGLSKGSVTSGFPGNDPEDVPLWSTTPRKEMDLPISCPTDAIRDGKVNMSLCISCGLCSPSFHPDGNADTSIIRHTEKVFHHSFHLYLFDAGSCGACNSEIKSLSNPVYDMSRLGIFFASNPKHADALLVVGVLSQGMKDALRRAYEDMPKPSLVFAVGACAISGGIIGKSIEEAIPADVIVPGCPPNPFTILDALLKSRGDR
ncbi:MAG: NADH:ubiquinone oxidoreductase [Thermoplasmataceae archaeon]|jgi:Ni,Fe-hydrogenase III small subunit